MKLVNSSGTTVASYDYDPYGNVISSTGSVITSAGNLADINPLRYRGYYYDTDTGLYYLQSRYYDPEIGRFINADSLASTGQGILGNNMYAYCNNNPVTYVDSSGTIPRAIPLNLEDEESERDKNIDNMMAFFGVSSPEDIPILPENCMVFMENIYSITIGGITYVYGRTIVMDSDKYCMYTFKGLSYGASGIPFDYCVTKGYVYNLNDARDYCGFFYGGSFNQVSNIFGGAIASNGVYAEIISGVGYGAGSIGASVTHYSTPYSSWTYGKANINWYDSPYNYYSPWDRSPERCLQ